MLSIPKYPEQYAQHFPAIFYLLCCASQHHVWVGYTTILEAFDARGYGANEYSARTLALDDGDTEGFVVTGAWPSGCQPFFWLARN